MRFTTAIAISFSAAISLVAAQTKCDAQNIVDACVSGYKSRIDTCNLTPNDWICLCDVYNDVLTCYNNCPNSNDKPVAQNTATSYCAAAQPLRAAASASAASIASVAATQSHAATSAASPTGSGTRTTGTVVPSASSFKTNAAASAGIAPAGAALVAMFGALGLL